MGNWWILVQVKLKETYNERMQFGHSGLWFILLELATLMATYIIMRLVLKNSADSLELAGISGFLIVVTFLVAFGHGYLFSERMLFGSTAQVNQLLAVNPQDVVLSTVLVTYMSNLRPTLLSPILMALALTHAWSPDRQVPLFGSAFLVLLFGIALAVLTVMLVKRFVNWLSGLAFITATALQVGGFIGTAWLVINLLRSTVTEKAWVRLLAFQHVLWWVPALLMASGITLFALTRLAYLWRENLWQQEGQGSRRLEKHQFLSILALLSAFRLPSSIQAVVLKEWLSLKRNPLTVFRMVIWSIFSLFPLLYPGLRSLVFSFSYPLIVVYVIWFFSFGELIATTYQAEGNRLGLLWLAAVSPGQLALGKVLAYFPLAFFAAGTTGVMIFIFGWHITSALLTIAFAFIGIVAGISLSLAPACLSMNTVNYQGNSITEMAFEQVPTTFWSILSTFILGGFIAIFGILTSLLHFWVSIVVGSSIIGIIGIAATGYLLKWRFRL
jgi:hypothetical protein